MNDQDDAEAHRIPGGGSLSRMYARFAVEKNNIREFFRSRIDRQDALNAVEWEG